MYTKKVISMTMVINVF